MSKLSRGAQLNFTHPSAHGSTGYWLLNEGTGDKVFDYSRNGNIGDINGATWVPGGLRFNGVDNIVRIPSFMPESADGKHLSGSVWVKTTTTAEVYFFTKYDNGTGVRTFLLHISGGKVRILVVPTGGGWPNVKNYEGNTIINDGDRHHVAFTWDGTGADGMLKLYIDGVEDTPYNKLQDYPTTVLDTGTADVMLGSYLVNDVPTGHFEGLLNEPILYNRTLSTAKVLQLYLNPSAMFEMPISPAIFGALIAAAGIVPFRRRIEGY